MGRPQRIKTHHIKESKVALIVLGVGIIRCSLKCPGDYMTSSKYKFISPQLVNFEFLSNPHTPI